MLTSFTRNYQDNSTEAGFQFTFYCDLCNDGFKSSFIESETYKKGSLLRGIAGGARVLGNLSAGLSVVQPGVPAMGATCCPKGSPA